MKKIFCFILFAAAAFFSAAAQPNQNYLSLYNKLVDRVGFSGVGVDNLLNKWYKADSLDLNVMVARFNYHYSKSVRDTVISTTAKKYLGKAPIMTLKDTAGVAYNYFNESLFNETEFGNALRFLDKAIALDNTRMDLHILKANALLSFEKDSPDLTLEFLKDIAAKNYGKSYKWSYPDMELDKDYISALMQDYCYEFYKLGTPQGYEAFRILSEAMTKYEPKNPGFVNNLGSYYYVVKGKTSKAKKFYTKALKLDPEDAIAKKNLALIELKSKKK